MSLRQDMRVVINNLKKIVYKNGGRVKERTSYNDDIRFVLNGYMYYYHLPTMSSIPNYYVKTKVVDGKYSLNTYMDELNSTWTKRLNQCSRNTDECLERAAEDLYKSLLNAKESDKYKEEGIICVPNTYNGSTHTEKVIKPERFEKVDF